MIGNARRALAESAMWSVVGAGSARRDSGELATSFVRYQGASDGSAEVRTAQGGSSLAAGGADPRAGRGARELDGGAVADIDAALALPAAATAMRA
jgi:hypothetical protein